MRVGARAGAAAQEAVAVVVGRPARLRHVEREETRLVPGQKDLSFATLDIFLLAVFLFNEGLIFTSIANSRF